MYLVETSIAYTSIAPCDQSEWSHSSWDLKWVSDIFTAIKVAMDSASPSDTTIKYVDVVPAEASSWNISGPSVIDTRYIKADWSAVEHTCAFPPLHTCMHPLRGKYLQGPRLP